MEHLTAWGGMSPEAFNLKPEDLTLEYRKCYEFDWRLFVHGDENIEQFYEDIFGIDFSVNSKLMDFYERKFKKDNLRARDEETGDITSGYFEWVKSNAEMFASKSEKIKLVQKIEEVGHNKEKIKNLVMDKLLEQWIYDFNQFGGFGKFVATKLSNVIRDNKFIKGFNIPDILGDLDLSSFIKDSNNQIPLFFEL